MSVGGHIAALYVERDGVYANLPGVDVWDESRDLFRKHDAGKGGRPRAKGQRNAS